MKKNCCHDEKDKHLEGSQTNHKHENNFHYEICCHEYTYKQIWIEVVKDCEANYGK